MMRQMSARVSGMDSVNPQSSTGTVSVEDGPSALPRGLTQSNASRGLQSLAKSVSIKRTMSSARLMTEGRTLDTSENAVAVRDQRLKKAIVREPLIVPAKYASDWTMDLFALAHNAVRIEIQDLYKILSSLSKRRLDLLTRDFAGFFTWFALFSRFITRLLEMEENVIFPWVEGSMPIPKGPISKPERTKTFAFINERLRSVAALKDSFEKDVDQAVLDKFFTHFDDLSSAAVDFFLVCERAVPVFIKKNCDQGQKQTVETAFVKNLAKGMPEILYTVARGISTEVTGFAKRYTPALARMSMAASRRKWDEHNELVQAFTELQKEYEKTYRGKRAISKR